MRGSGESGGFVFIIALDGVCFVDRMGSLIVLRVSSIDIVGWPWFVCQGSGRSIPILYSSIRPRHLFPSYLFFLLSLFFSHGAFG